MLKVVLTGQPDFQSTVDRLAHRGELDFSRVEPAVREICDAVRREGDEALQRFSLKFDGRRADPLVLKDFDGEAALARLPEHARAALVHAAERIARYHSHQREEGFQYEEEGVVLGARVRPLRRVGVYAPGGKARYPSSVLMAAIPARVAGVTDVVLATPLTGDASDDTLFAAAHLSGVTEIVNLGGAQAVAALAYGTSSVRRVDKIVGPGNIYVACAKRLVFGAVAIDSIAGPSEILVVADDSADPLVVAADLLSQAEHDEQAYPLLVCCSAEFAHATCKEVARQLGELPRRAIAQVSVENNGYAFVVPDREGLAHLADRLAPEHLALHVTDADGLLERIPNAGAAFVGHDTPEAAGDYLAGPSHVLPTGGAVRFGSPLGVYDFVVRTSVIRYSRETLTRHAKAITDFARLEGLEAHARAVEARLT